MTVPSPKTLGATGHTSDHELIRGELLEAETHQNASNKHVAAGGTTGQVYKKLSNTDGDAGWANETAGGGGGVSDHGALTGLTDDDHAQYHNDARGDARYTQRSNNGTDFASISSVRNNLGLGDSATKSIGTAAGTVAAGDHTHAGGAGHVIANQNGSAMAQQPVLGFRGAGVDVRPNGPNVVGVGVQTLVVANGAYNKPRFAGQGVVGGAWEVPCAMESSPLLIPAGTAYFVPILASFSDFTIDKLGVDVLVAGGTLEMAMYTEAYNRVSTSYVTGISASTTGFKAVTLPTPYSFLTYEYSQSHFYLAVLALGSSVSLRSGRFIQPMQASPDTAFGSFDDYQQAYVRTGLSALPTNQIYNGATQSVVFPRIQAQRSV